MESCKAFKMSLQKPKHRNKKEIIKNKNVFNYNKTDKVSNKIKNKVITTIKTNCKCGCGSIKPLKPYKNIK